jgi:hypothetical protein
VIPQKVIALTESANPAILGWPASVFAMSVGQQAANAHSCCQTEASFCLTATEFDILSPPIETQRFN